MSIAMSCRAGAATCVLAALMLCISTAADCRGIGLVDGLWVMKQADDRYQGDDIQEDMYLTLEKVPYRGTRARHLEVRWLEKDYGKTDKLIIHFVGPKHASGITLLMEIKPYIDDDRWLYFPSANLIRRVKASDQHSNFMGTDFTYYDLSEREPEEENHKLLRIEKLQGIDCYLVETTPKKTIGEGYSKKITWVDKDRFIKLRIHYFDKAGKFQKRYEPDGWKKIDGIWTPTRLVMEDEIRGHRTTIERRNIRYNQNISGDYFLPRHVDCVVYKDGKFSLIPFDQRPTRVWKTKKKNRWMGQRNLPPQKDGASPAGAD